MSDFSIPPTQVEIAEQNPQGKFLTNPQWLRWFVAVQKWLSGIGAAVGRLFPPQPNGQPQTATSLLAGEGVPNNADGENGDYYFRSNGTSVGEYLYFKSSGTWSSIL